MDVKLTLDTETVVFTGVIDVCCVLGVMLVSVVAIDGCVIFMDVALLSVDVLGGIGGVV